MVFGFLFVSENPDYWALERLQKLTEAFVIAYYLSISEKNIYITNEGYLLVIFKKLKAVTDFLLFLMKRLY